MTTLTRPTARMIAAVALVLGVALPLVVTLAFDERVDAVEARFDTRADDLRTRIDAVDSDGTIAGAARAADLDRRLDVIEQGLADIARRLEELTVAIDTVEAEVVDEQAAAPPTTTRPAPRAAPAPTTTGPARVLAASAGDAFTALAACESTGDHDGAEPQFDRMRKPLPPPARRFTWNPASPPT